MSAARQRWMTSPHRILILFFIQTMDRTSRTTAADSAPSWETFAITTLTRSMSAEYQLPPTQCPLHWPKVLLEQSDSLVSNFTEFTICTQKSFGDLIARITQAATEDVKTIKQVCKPVKRKRVLTKKYSKQRPR